MEAFWAAFLLIFFAEMGDKTQFLVMALAGRYDSRRVFVGMTLGIIVVHALAVLLGATIGSFLPAEKMAIVASILFICFGLWSLKGETDDEEEECQTSRFGPVMTVALTFIIGEMGDKTQLAAVALASEMNSWLMVFIGAVVGMIVADGMGLVAGNYLQKKISPPTMQKVSAAIFIVFGVAGLVQCFFMG
ncbi:Putative Ca2+/H+ antiporter, TMEM165/GDT1 family [Selenomonas ruminantium]|uniref:GDT1 family protein n=1 Tax=Selenomonas ruminantium TaxID=971 RepID=A0A1M6TLS4_SELRU|nr:TMEM165/GDT1 family protein [Selenomonas ruminantium]SHK57945.1 Putative Ca2+/H+ antiporter, TMEM165/GDT1 family [Selenomonas ruminantium]